MKEGKDKDNNKKKEQNKILKVISVQLMLVLGIILAYLFVRSEYVNIIPECRIYQEFGILCPSCGGTRAVISMTNGNIFDALRYNLIISIGIIYLIIVDIVYIINLKYRNKKIEKLILNPYYTILFVVILVVYTVIRNIL